MKRKFCAVLVMLAALLLTGCAMRTVDQMYCLPKRSETHDNLQSAIRRAMEGMEYCAPLAGENQQTVQQADLDGDGQNEYLLFAKGTAERPLQVLVFCQQDGGYVLMETIESNGAAFDQVEYVQMDHKGGVELVIGRQVSDQVLRAMSVYTFSGGQAELLLTANYSKFLTCDLDADQLAELMVLRPGQTDSDNGVAVLYGMEQGVMERSNEVNMSEPVDKLKRVITGKLYGGTPAVYVGSAVEESAIITDVYAMVDGVFTNVSFSNDSGTSVQTLRNHYVYADDIDDDGVVELPDLITTKPLGSQRSTKDQYLIRWYAMKPDGTEVDKMYTYHNFLSGWYLKLDESWAEWITVEYSGTGYDFYLWQEDQTKADRIFTVYAFSGSNREERAVADNRFVLYRTDSTVYAAYLEVASGTVPITQDDLIYGFQPIRQDWKTGET